MGDPESATGVLFTCGVIIIFSFCVIVRALHALDEEDNQKEKREE